MGEVIRLQRGKSDFEFGSIYNFGEAISEESKMSAFFIFANSIYEEDDASAAFSDRSVVLSQLYPIYVEEIEIIKQLGVHSFFSLPDVDFFDVQRKPVAGTLS